MKEFKISFYPLEMEIKCFNTPNPILKSEDSQDRLTSISLGTTGKFAGGL